MTAETTVFAVATPPVIVGKGLAAIVTPQGATSTPSTGNVSEYKRLPPTVVVVVVVVTVVVVVETDEIATNVNCSTFLNEQPAIKNDKINKI